MHGENANFESEYLLANLYRFDATDPQSRNHWYEADRRGVNAYAITSTFVNFDRTVQALYKRARNGQPVFH